MAAYPIVVVDDELLEKLPERFKADPRYQKGASLELVPIVRRDGDSWNAARRYEDDSWRSLEGVFAGVGLSATEIKRQERDWELAHDEQKFGTQRPSWPNPDR